MIVIKAYGEYQYNSIFNVGLKAMLWGEIECCIDHNSSAQRSVNR